MITQFKIFELINNAELVKTTINNTLIKIKKINNNELNLRKERSDKLVLNINFEVIIDYKKQVINEIEKLKNQLSKSGTYLSYYSHSEYQFKFVDDETMNLEIDYDKPKIEKFYLYIKDTHFKRVKPPRYLYHMTSHKNYRSIIENGLEPRENEVYSDTPMYDHPPAIYASSEKDFFGNINDDEWRIDTSMIDNKWWQDYNLYDEEQQKKSFLTYEPIPVKALKLIKNEYDN